MPKKKASKKKSEPKLKRSEFQALLPIIYEEIDKWWEKESEKENLDDVFSEDVKKQPIFSGIPLIDSKIVMGASHIFEEHLGKKLEANDVKKGGYESIEEMKEDLTEKFEIKIFGK